MNKDKCIIEMIGLISKLAHMSEKDIGKLYHVTPTGLVSPIELMYWEILNKFEEEIIDAQENIIEGEKNEV